MADLANLQTIRDRAAHIRSGDLVLLLWKFDDVNRYATAAPSRAPKRAFWATVTKTGQRLDRKSKARHRVITVYVGGQFVEVAMFGDQAITRHARPDEIMTAAR